MIPCMCLVQEGQINERVASTLKSKLEDFAQKTFNAPASVNWLVVGRGNGFTEAKPSTTSLVSFQSNQALSKEDRTAMLEGICDLWMAETGCSIAEIVASVSDPQA